MISGSDTRVPSLCPQRLAKRNQPARAQRGRPPMEHRTSGFRRPSPRDGFSARWSVLYQPRPMPSSGKPDSASKTAEISEIIFSGLLPIRSRAGIETVGWVHNPAYERAFLNSGRAPLRAVSKFRALHHGRWRKLPCHGLWRTPRSSSAASSVGDCATHRWSCAPWCRVTVGDGGLVDTPDRRCYQVRPLPARPAPQDRSRRTS